ncbi:hypothetical protein [Labilibacter marinus]|uniref:hypothetical protein n=1 Tax=Labilibacter marinus TaxID=1477105 RepID=UPI00082D9FEE|nr:hypothetical protein [Labilibacter marinus]
MIINYQFIEAKGLLIKRYFDEFNLEQHVLSMTEIISQPSWNNVERVLTDARELDPRGVYKNIDAIVSFRKEVIKKEYLDVFIVDSPLLTVATFLMQEKLNKLNFDFRYCSTVYQAEKLLEISETDFDLTEHLNSLSKNKLGKLKFIKPIINL